jgi:hypothetical protein
MYQADEPSKDQVLANLFSAIIVEHAWVSKQEMIGGTQSQVLFFNTAIEPFGRNARVDSSIRQGLEQETPAQDSIEYSDIQQHHCRSHRIASIRVASSTI